MASISSCGAAAVIGLALVAAAALAFSGGFASGGFTGTGGKFEPAGIVHRGEFVLPADVTSRLGVGNLYRLMSDTRAGYAEGGLVGGGDKGSLTGGGNPVQVVFVDDPKRASRMAADPDFETHIIDIAKRNRAEIMI